MTEFCWFLVGGDVLVILVCFKIFKVESWDMLGLFWFLFLYSSLFSTSHLSWNSIDSYPHRPGLETQRFRQIVATLSQQACFLTTLEPSAATRGVLLMGVSECFLVCFFYVFVFSMIFLLVSTFFLK